MSGQYGTPDWTNTDAAPNSPAPVESTGWSSASGRGATISNAALPTGKTNNVQRLLSIFSIGLSAMMCTLGVFGILDHDELAQIFVSVYMILFAFLLFFYELMWWTAIPAVNKNLRVNFGFMYGVKGRAAYLIFVAFLVLGLKNDRITFGWLRYTTGALFLGTGILMLVLAFSKPEVMGKYEAPTAGFTGETAPTTSAPTTETV